MKKAICLLFLMFLLCSCTPSEKIQTPNTTSAPSDTENNVSDTYIKRYNVYAIGAESIEPDEFSIAMANNPIDIQMEEALLKEEIDINTIIEKYLEKWKDELLFSINNLKQYLSKDDIDNFNTAQKSWEGCLSSNNRFDYTLIKDYKIKLGSQYETSKLIYLLEQYKERIFHIKYMTYLLENYSVNEFSVKDQLWNDFSVD